MQDPALPQKAQVLLAQPQAARIFRRLLRESFRRTYYYDQCLYFLAYQTLVLKYVQWSECASAISPNRHMRMLY